MPCESRIGSFKNLFFFLLSLLFLCPFSFRLLRRGEFPVSRTTLGVMLRLRADCVAEEGGRPAEHNSFTRTHISNANRRSFSPETCAESDLALSSLNVPTKGKTLQENFLATWMAAWDRKLCVCLCSSFLLRSLFFCNSEFSLRHLRYVRCWMCHSYLALPLIKLTGSTSL